MDSWNTIKGFSDYLISTSGRVKKKSNGKILAEHNYKGGKCVNICDDLGIWKTRKIENLLKDNFDIIRREDVKYLLTKIKIRKNNLDAVDCFRIANFHIELFGDIYSGLDPMEQIKQMYIDLEDWIER